MRRIFFRLFLASLSFSASFYLHIFRVVLLLQASTMQQTTARPLLSLPFSRCYEIGYFGALLVVCCVLVLLSCC